MRVSELWVRIGAPSHSLLNTLDIIYFKICAYSLVLSHAFISIVLQLMYGLLCKDNM